MKADISINDYCNLNIQDLNENIQYLEKYNLPVIETFI